MCLLRAYQKMTHYFFYKLDKLFLFFLWEDCHGRSLHIEIFWGRGKKLKKCQKYCIFYTQNQPQFVDFKFWCFSLPSVLHWWWKKWKVFKIMCSKRKPENFFIILDLHTSGTKIVDIPMSKITYERQGKIIEETILQTLKFVPAFLSNHYPHTRWDITSWR